MVSLDFDDGWSSIYDNGIPILNAAGFKSTQYIYTDPYINEWEDFMTLQQLLELKNQGHEIGGHSKSHAHLTNVSSSRLLTEVSGSRTTLINSGLGEIRSFAYPFGEYNTTVINAVKNAGYSYARSVDDEAYNDKNTSPYLLKTKNIEKSITFATVKSWIDGAVANKKWLIIVFHEILNNGTQYSSTPADLQKIVDYLKTNNIKVVTVSEGYNTTFN